MSIVSSSHAVVHDPDVGLVPITYSDISRADSASNPQHVFLLLHGGGGPLTVASFAERLATDRDARVIVPTHPGFGGTPRPDSVTSVRDVAALYTGLLDELDVQAVTVVGNSIGGWIAAELGVRGSDRISSIELIDAVGIEVHDHPVVDFFALTLAEIAERSYFSPEQFRIDPSVMTAEQQAAMAGNRATLAVYAGQPSMIDPTLLGRLASVPYPTVVIWGEADRIVDPEYGRAYSAAIPGAEFVLMRETGHLPQLESPDRLLPLVWNFADANTR